MNASHPKVSMLRRSRERVQQVLSISGRAGVNPPYANPGEINDELIDLLCEPAYDTGALDCFVRCALTCIHHSLGRQLHGPLRCCLCPLESHGPALWPMAKGMREAPGHQ